MEVESGKFKEFSLDWKGNEEQSCDFRWLLKLKVRKIGILCKLALMKTRKVQKG